ncbi:MAG: zinc-ribbon domain-containing protein [Syntrophomonas sp.]|nr:zinc-ribbon domain-containing protein [Syntrophomonas sp.]
MKIKRCVSLVLIVFMLLGFIVPISAEVASAPSDNKASVYVKISVATSYQRVTEIRGDNLAGVPDKKNFTDNFSILVEGTTELEADMFDFEDEYKKLSPVEREIRASCGGSGSISVKGTKTQTHPTNPSNIRERDFPFNSEQTWSYAMDGKELVDEYDEAIDLIHNLTVYPSEKKGEAPTYELILNQDVLSSINMYHILTRGTTKSNTSDFEGSHSHSGVIEEDGSYGASLLAATTHYMAVDEEQMSEESFTKGQFKLENDKFVSSGHFSNTYKPDEYETTTVTITYTINKDPEIKSIQVNQGLGRYEYTDDENYVPATDFVAGKETAIQVFFFEETPIDKIGDVKLEVYRDGARIATLEDFIKDKDHNSLNFIPNSMAQCENWKAGTYKFKALYKETEYVLDSVKLSKIPKLRILAVPLKANYDGFVKSPGNQWHNGHKFLREVFPVAKKDVEWIIRAEPLDVSSYMFNVTSATGQWKVAEQLKTLQTSSSGSQYDAIVGFIPEATADSVGFTYRNLSVVVAEDQPDMMATVAHEIGHLYNLGEEYKGGAYNTSVNMPPYGYSGMDWFDKSKPASGTNENIKASDHGEGVNISNNLHPFEVGSRGLLEDSIGFMGGGAQMDNIWITPSVWKHLYHAFQVKSDKAPNENGDKNNIALRPAGYITDSGEIVVEYPWKVTYGEDKPITQTAAQTGTYEIQALDAAGTVLARQFFTPTFFPVTYTGQSSTTSESDKFSLNDISIPFRDGTAKFSIIKDNVSIIEVPVSGHAPTIRLKTPVDGGEFAESKTIEWEGNDPDGDKLYYTVEYSRDGTEWLVLQPNITDSQLAVDFSLLPGGEKACLRIIASDGINSASADTEPFTVPSKAPVLYVDGAVVATEGVTFSASAYDSADGWMYDDRITWTSDKDGAIGNGSSLFLTTLANGKHSITVTATNAHGQQAVETFDITVDGSSGYMTGLLFWAAVIIVILLILVMIIWAATKKKKCPNCGYKYKKKAPACPKCNYPFAGGIASPKQNLEEQPLPSSHFCPNCGKQYAPTAKFCGHCGNKI